MRPVRFALVLCLLLQNPLFAQGPSATPAPPVTAPPLPVRRIILYKTGVGYFEHLGNVVGRQDVGITFTSSQLNDVLKSLTAIDLGKGRIASINYNSVAPIGQRLGSLRLPLDLNASSFQLLGTLRGARVEVTADGSSVQGRLMSTERLSRSSGQQVHEINAFSILTDSGELRSFELNPSVRVRVVERELRQEIGRYLDLVGSTREQDVRTMTISSIGTGERPIFVSYISEVPIWKSTYRLVLPSKASKPLLQGWAIVDNTTGTDWDTVELSLVAGAPQSFVQRISQPYYSQRPVVPMPSNILLTPQTHQATLRAGAGSEEPQKQLGQLNESVTVVASEPGSRALPPPPAAMPAPGVGIGQGLGRGMAGGKPEVVGSRPAYEQARDAAPAAAAGDLGDLFEYRITEPVTLTKNQSALVPIVNAEIDADRVSLWNRSSGSGRPLRAVWLTNASGLTLDGGSITIVDSNAFAGEGLITSLKPGERRLVSYAADLGVLVSAKSDGAPSRLSRLTAKDGVVIQESEERATWTYAIRNEDAAARTLVIEHPTREGWRLVAGQKPAEETADTQRFRLDVGAKQEASLVVRDTRTSTSRVAAIEMNDGLVAYVSAAGISTEELRKVMGPVLEKRAELAGYEKQTSDVEARRRTITQDQQRLRENMKALRGSAEEKQLLLRYTRQLDQQEDQLAEIEKTMAEVTARLNQGRLELAKLVNALSFDFRAVER